MVGFKGGTLFTLPHAFVLSLAVMSSGIFSQRSALSQSVLTRPGKLSRASYVLYADPRVCFKCS